MIIREWVELINQQLPTVTQIVEKYEKVQLPIDEAKAFEHLQRLTITYEPGNILTVNSSLHELIERTNISSVGIGTINFYPSVEESLLGDDYLEFACYNDFYRFCFKGDVIVYNGEEDHFEKVSPDLDRFLEFLTEYNKFYMDTIFGVHFAKHDSLNRLDELGSQGFSKKIINDLVLFGK